MHFLLDAKLPRSLVSVVQRAGHTCTHVRDTKLSAASDAQIAEYARATGVALITRDLDFADVRNYSPEQFAGIVVLRLPDTATANMICGLVEQLLSQTETVTQFPGRLAIAQSGRVRLRPPIA